MAKVIYWMALLFYRSNTQKVFKFGKSESISIPGPVSWEFILLKVFLNSVIPFLLLSEMVQESKQLWSYIKVFLALVCAAYQRAWVA
jgi:hypothetical protein